MNRWYKIIALILFFLPVFGQPAKAETLEEQLNNLVGPKEQYSTYLSPVYIRNNTTEEQVSPHSGELTLTQTDYVLPGVRGLDLEIKRIYKSGTSNVREMKAQYMNGAWVDYVESGVTTSSFYEDRYNLGIGMRFSFPSMEIRENNDGTSHMFYHTETGDVYRLKSSTVDGLVVYLPEAQTVRDVTFMEAYDFTNGQADGASKYAMTRKDGTKQYFADDGRLLAIVDRYGNKIVFEYETLTYTIDRRTITKKLVSRITDTVGRVVTIEYKEDPSFTVGSIAEKAYNADNSHEASQNPNDTDSGDLQGKFQVVVRLPGNKTIVYDKSAVLVSDSKHVLRTRLQRVIDTDGKPKYHFWYEQPDLGFSYMNKEQYSAYNRYENLVQIDYLRTNRIKRYTYNSYTKGLHEGSMQYRKIFQSKELVKRGFDPGQPQFLDKFVVEEKDKTNYHYTNEASGYGFEGYKEDDETYLKDTYRYYSEITDMRGNLTKYTYDGLHQLIMTERSGADHKETVTHERDELKLIKKQELLSYRMENGQPVGEPVRKIENFRYDEYGNLTNYTGPLAERDANGYPVNSEHMVIYTYAYDKFHTLLGKTWKQGPDITGQIMHTVDDKGNITRETIVNTDDAGQWVVTDYEYDGYGNMTKKSVGLNGSGGQLFVTYYEYATDLHGADVKGAYLTKEYRLIDGQESAVRYGYDMDTGNRTTELDRRGHATSYQYDALNRVVLVTLPDLSTESTAYEESRYDNFRAVYTDPNGTKYMYEYDIAGNLLQSGVWDRDDWRMLHRAEYDAKGNKTKETDANGHSVRYEYDSLYRLTSKSLYEGDSVLKGTMSVAYRIADESGFPLVKTITDEEGYVKQYYYDIDNRLAKLETTPDNVNFYTTSYTYDYVGNKIAETDALNRTTEYEYDSLNRLVLHKDASGSESRFVYNALNKAVLWEEPGGKTTEYAYNALGLVFIRKVYLQGSDDYTYEAYTYDPAGNMLTARQGRVQDGEDIAASSMTYAYDNRNRMTDEYRRIDETRTARTQFSYDNNGNKTQVSVYGDESLSQFRRYTYRYDFAGRTVEETGAYQSAAGEEHGRYQTVMERDYAGQIRKRHVWNGSGFDTTEYEYDHRGQVTEKREPFLPDRAGTTRYQYNKAGYLTAEMTLIGGNPAVYAYAVDGLGRTTRKTDPLGHTTRYIYDAVGNLIKQIDPRYSHIADDAAPGYEYEYDANNRLVRTFMFDGQTKTVLSYSEYDGRGNVVKEADGEGYNAGQPEKSVGIRYEYDADNRRIRVMKAQTAADNERNGTQLYDLTLEYDGAGNIVAETDILGHATTYSYYGNGLLREKTYPDGLKEAWDYDHTGKALTVATDRMGRITRTHRNIFDKPYRIEYPDGTSERFVYSPKGELLESYDRAGHATVFRYDLAGNMTAKREFISAAGGQSAWKLAEMTYDEAGRLLTAETFAYTASGVADWDGDKQSAGDQVVHTYDRAGRLVRTAGPNGRESVMEYDPAGNVITRKRKIAEGDYEVRRMTYDVQSRMTGDTLLVPASDLHNQSLAGAKFDNEFPDRVWSTVSYAYYRNGAIRRVVDPLGNPTEYAYDYNQNLLKKTDPLQAVVQYRYDAKGRLAEEINPNGAAARYEYDLLDRLIRRIDPAADGGAAVRRFVYDAAGNLVKDIAPNQYDTALDTDESVLSMVGATYAYDVMNRRVATTAADGSTVEYVAYDALGRVSKVVDGLRYTGDMAASAGTEFAYDGLGRLVKKTDALQQTSHYEYDVLGRMTRTTDARGYSTVMAYAPDGTLVDVIRPDGGTISYTYDKLGRKIAETDPLGSTTTYTYSAFGKEKQARDPYGHTLETRYDLGGNSASFQDKRGYVTLMKYDRAQRLVEKRSPMYTDASGNTVYAIEKVEYDNAGNVVKKTLTDSGDPDFVRETGYTYYDNNLVRTVTDAGGAFTRYVYDKNGNVTKTEKLRDAAVYDIEKWEYDTRNRPVKWIRLVDAAHIAELDGAPSAELADPEYPGMVQVVTGYEYDMLGNRTKEIDPRAYLVSAGEAANRDEYTVVYTYDALNRVDRVVRKFGGSEVYRQYTYDASGNKIKERNERGFETGYSYDALNRLAVTTNADGSQWTNIYDLAGNLISQTNAKQQTMTYAYDRLNRLVTVTDAYNKVVERNVYDVSGNLVKKIDARGFLSAATDEERYGWQYTYDAANRLVSVLDPELAAAGKPYTTQYAYNAAGQTIGETNALGQTSRYVYDSGGRLVSVTDPLGVSVTYRYDKAGNKLAMTDGRDKVTEYGYGAFGLLLWVNNAARRKQEYRYDIALNVASVTDRAGRRTVYRYDNRNLLLERRVVETGDAVSYSYDELGNRVSMTDESGTSTYTYDKLDQLVLVAKDGQQRLTYTYDALGNLETVTAGDGFTTAYTYDLSNRMESVTFQGRTTRYIYDENGNRAAVEYAGGVRGEYTFDRNNRLLTLTNRNAAGGEISSYRYTYDDAGRQIGKTDSFGTSTYAYDDAGRVVQAETPGKTTVYSYDRAGNRISLNETYTSLQPSGFTDPASGAEVQYAVKKSEYVYSPVNELLRLTETMYDAEGAKVLEKTVQYLYDDNGNEIRQQVSYLRPHRTSYRQMTDGDVYSDEVAGELNTLVEKVSSTYDGFNRLKQTERVTSGERVLVEYHYDGDNLRVRKVVRRSTDSYMPQTTNYLYDRQHVVLETDGANAVVTRYVRGLHYIARIDGAGKLSYYMYNGHGDVVQTVNETGDVENQYEYDIFGNPTLTIEQYANAIRYSGEFLDAETGLYYLRARYYSPYTGRFISEDSYWGEDSNPLSLNLYTYTYNDPIQYVDPTGHAPDTSYEAYEESGARGYISYDEFVDNVTRAYDDDDSDSYDSYDTSYEAYEDSGARGYISYDEFVRNVSRSNSDYDSRNSETSRVPDAMDWDGDNRVDTREDRRKFDSNGNDIADWLETEYEQNWMYDRDLGWEYVEESARTDAEGPTAEHIRYIHDAVIAKLNSGNLKFDTFEELVQYVTGGKSKSKAVSILSADFGNLLFDDYEVPNMTVEYMDQRVELNRTMIQSFYEHMRINQYSGYDELLNPAQQANLNTLHQTHNFGTESVKLEMEVQGYLLRNSGCSYLPDGCQGGTAEVVLTMEDALIISYWKDEESSAQYITVRKENDEVVSDASHDLMDSLGRLEAQGYTFHESNTMFIDETNGSYFASGRGAGKGRGNAGAEGTVKIEGMPPIVQSRINISNDGFKHVVQEHFSTKNKSQFTISQDELRTILSDKNVVNTPVTRTLDSADGIRYVREVTLDKPIGTDKFNNFNPTSTMTILTDSHGNLVTASPGIIK